jgi:NNP family nitrate/nitrite transporter-like MFS transporter
MTVLMALTVPAIWLMSYATAYWHFLVIGLFVGLAGGSFSVGTPYVARWFPKNRQGFRHGRVWRGQLRRRGQQVHRPGWWWPSAGPWCRRSMRPSCWPPGPVLVVQLQRPGPPGAPNTKFSDQLKMLKDPEGAQVLPVLQHRVRRLCGAVAVDGAVLRRRVRAGHPRGRGLLAACFSLPGGVLRAVGGWLSDKYGAHSVTWWVMWVSWICLFLLSYPQTDFTVLTVNGPKTFHIGLNVYTFTGLMFVLGIAWAFGKASVFKYISDDFPTNIGTVSGIVGLAGGLGGFVLPIMFGALMDLTGIRSSAFMLMYGVVWVSLIWMYWTEVRRTEVMGDNATRSAFKAEPKFRHILPEPHEHPTGAIAPARQPAAPTSPTGAPKTTPSGKAPARRSPTATSGSRCPPAVRLRGLGHVGNHHRADAEPGLPVHQAELFTLTAIAGISGATMRIPASFLIRLAGGRNTIFLTTAMLLAPAIGTGIVLQHKEWPLWVFQLMALWSGVGGGNFASSMSNISTFFPKRLQGTALGLNAGPGQLWRDHHADRDPAGDDLGLFGAWAASSMTLLKDSGWIFGKIAAGTPTWIQNAGFAWVLSLVPLSILCWFGMNNLKTVSPDTGNPLVAFAKITWLYTLAFIPSIGIGLYLYLPAPTGLGLLNMWVAIPLDIIGRCS